MGFVSFSTLFWRAFEELGCQLPAQRHTRCVCYTYVGFQRPGSHFASRPRYTFMFELCSPSNPVVVRYGCTRLVALGCRNRETFLEDNVEPFASLYNWAVPTRFKATSLQEVQAMAQKLSGTQAEGYVVCDAEFNRLKGEVGALQLQCVCVNRGLPVRQSRCLSSWRWHTCPLPGPMYMPHKPAWWMLCVRTSSRSSSHTSHSTERCLTVSSTTLTSCAVQWMHALPRCELV